MAKVPHLLTTLRHPDYARLTIAYTVSLVGSWAYNVALTVWIFDETGSVGWVAVTTVCRFVPALVFSAYAGVIADRVEKVRLMSRVDLAFAAVMVAMATVMSVHGAVAVVLALATVSSTMGTVYEPAAAGLTPLVVPERELASANALRNTIDNVVVIAGPGLGALLLLSGSPSLAVWLNAGTFVASAILIARVRVKSTAVDVTEGGEQGPLRQMLVGIRAMVGDSSVAVMVGYSVLATMLFGADTVLFVAVSAHLLGTGSDGYGYLLAGLGVGGVLAAPLVNRVEARPSLGPVILLGMAAYCLPTLLLLVAHSPVLGFVVQVVRGAGTLFVDVLAVTALQRTLTTDVLARVFGAFNGLLLAAVLVGSTTMSWIISGAGVDAAVWVAGAGYFGLSLLGLPWLRALDRRSRLRREELAPVIDLLERLDLFEQVPDGGLTQLASSAESLRVLPDTTVVSQGEPADAFYVVEAGRLTVRSVGKGGTVMSLPDLGPGEYFGEIGLIEGIPRTADVTATTEVTLLRIDGPTFVDALTAGVPSAAILDGAALRLERTHPSRTLRRRGLRTDPQLGGEE